MSRISYSQLSMFSECPLRWKLNYIDDVSVREPSIHLLFGNSYARSYTNLVRSYVLR